jgi:hypothetical protein
VAGAHREEEGEKAVTIAALEEDMTPLDGVLAFLLASGGEARGCRMRRLCGEEEGGDTDTQIANSLTRQRPKG